MIGQRERLSNAPSLTETWEIEVDLGAATSVAPPGFAHHLELSSAPTTLKLTTATDKEVKILWPEACPSSVPRSELESQLCDCRCCNTFAWHGHDLSAQLELDL